MNQAEFLALLDDRLSDGRRYPTLDEYSAALAALEPPRARGAAAWQGGRGAAVSHATRGGDRHASAIGAPNKPPERCETGQPLSRVASRRYQIEFRLTGETAWNRVGDGFGDLEYAEHYALQVRRVQPHVQVRVIDTREGA